MFFEKFAEATTQLRRIRSAGKTFFFSVLNFKVGGWIYIFFRNAEIASKAKFFEKEWRKVASQIGILLLRCRKVAAILLSRRRIDIFRCLYIHN